MADPPADAGLPWPLDAIARRPRLAALAGALCIAFSGVFYRYAAVSPETGTVFRCLFGLPLLVLVAWGERRRHGPMPGRTPTTSACVWWTSTCRAPGGKRLPPRSSGSSPARGSCS